MVPTLYHSKFFGFDLTRRRGPDDAGSLAGARVDLNPHQVDAALFAVRSTLSRGALIVDEGGLGKTIKAGLVIARRLRLRHRPGVEGCVRCPEWAWLDHELHLSLCLMGWQGQD